MQAVSYAKINLHLEILGKLPGDYHQVDTVICCIDLYDSIKYVLTKKQGIKLWSNLPELADKNNLMFKVASYIQGKYQPLCGIEMRLEKRIPVSAGLGGGSSNAANVIMALNNLWNLNLSEPEKHEIAAIFGSDINFFLQGGTARCTNRGEIIRQCEDIVIDHILLVNPAIAISARETYQKAQIPVASQIQRFDPLLGVSGWFNRLESGIRKDYPVIDGIIDDMQSYAARIAMMSGSGSTCFGIFAGKDAMRECLEHFARQGFWTKVTRTIRKEEYQQCIQN
ncbi:MAG: 4-(cytidine 5'-diphospho)-2-C-methyl-D-erythritol kinase [Candidatus Cloacimonadaceae bacterium]|nr:4-(cytidine 5'-diphospho)-2-C-methyl-D-erythritol kinase [Candidatus Cloacimonadaceae bacterium]MDP3114118.1 4-(cytidine 5'-diphospho)-2-C-methyl-D-erythritol kinase [Candidatus Cloacimonadaceae bacterium]